MADVATKLISLTRPHLGPSPEAYIKATLHEQRFGKSDAAGS